MISKQTGAALVEFALVLPLLLILTFITTEYSRAIYQYNVLTKSVRDAARYMSMQTPGDTSKYATIKNLVVYGNPAGSGSPLVIGLTTAKVPDPTWLALSPTINTVTVQIGQGAAGSSTRYVFTPLFSSVFGLTFGNIEFAPITATMRAPF